jgi:hypothetical protein
MWRCKIIDTAAPLKWLGVKITAASAMASSSCGSRAPLRRLRLAASGQDIGSDVLENFNFAFHTSDMTIENRRPLLNFYFDDSGTRHPDRRPPVSAFGDWFALGGILVEDERDAEARAMHAEFCGKWDIDYPLHSVKIRHKAKEFSWLATLPQHKAREFFNDLEAFILNAPVIGHACVIDRPGYRRRYEEKYGREQWSLCKTAFSVLAERVAKYATTQDSRVRVFAEKTDKKSDRMLRDYFKEMRENGMPFSDSSSSAYDPLASDSLKFRLLDFGFKTKKCPMTQLADLYLYPMCRSGYDDLYRPLKALRESGKLIESHLEECDHATMGRKFSCFDGT